MIRQATSAYSLDVLRVCFVSTGVSTRESGELALIEPGAKINGARYRDVRIFCQPFR